MADEISDLTAMDSSSWCYHLSRGSQSSSTGLADGWHAWRVPSSGGLSGRQMRKNCSFIFLERLEDLIILIERIGGLARLRLIVLSRLSEE